MVFVARLTVDGTFHKGLLRNIQLSQTVDYDMHMDIAAAVVTVHVGADQRLMPRKVGFYIFHADGLRLFTCQSTLVFVGRIEADEVVVRLDFVVILILVVLRIRKSYKKPNPLAKHIVCICGRALCWHKDKKTGEELFYCRYCRAHKENGKNLKVPAATIYKKVMDALELEHLEKEKLAAAIQQGAGRKAIEVVRAEKSVQMKSVLAELNMEQFRRVPLYESYIADEITEEQYRAELLDYEEAHRKLNEQLTTIMEDTLVWERALSLRNPWIQQMAQYKTPEELDRNFVKKYIEQVTVTLRDDGQAEISLTMKTDE